MAPKACDVTQLPPGLRQDANIQNGIYVGRRLNHLNIGCSQDPKEDQIDLGSCQTPTPQTAYVDDKNGVVYLPLGEDCYKKLDEENGIAGKFGFGKRASSWWEFFRDRDSISSLRYLFFGASAVRSADFDAGMIVEDRYADVLDHAGEISLTNPSLLLAQIGFWSVGQRRRVSQWIEAVERDPSPQTPGKQKGRLVVEVVN